MCTTDMQCINQVIYVNTCMYHSYRVPSETKGQASAIL